MKASAPPTDSAVTPATQTKRVLDDPKLDLILGKVTSLPPLAPVASRLLSLSGPNDADLEEVAMLVESDPAMTAKILGLCRNANTGLGNKITSVKRAVVMVGIGAVQVAALSVAALEALGGERPSLEDEKDSVGFDDEGFWRFSIAMACASSIVAKAHPKFKVSPDEAFAAGILSGVGQRTLDLIVPHSYTRIIRLAEAKRVSIAAAERAILGLDQFTIARRLAEHWNLPPALGTVLWLQGQPLGAFPDDESRPMIHILCGARALCRNMHVGWTGDGDRSPDIERYWRKLGLDPSREEEISSRLHEAVALRSESLGLESLSAPELLRASIANANDQLTRAVAQISTHAARAGRAQETVSEITTFVREAMKVDRLEDVVHLILESAHRAGYAQPAILVVQDRASGQTRVWLDDHDGPIAVTGKGDSDADPSKRPSQAELASRLGFPPDSIELLPMSAGNMIAHLVVQRASEAKTGDALPLVWAECLASAITREKQAHMSEQLAQSLRELEDSKEQLADAHAMAHLGEMTAGAAHEMNNPLTVIRGRSLLLEATLQDESDLQSARAIAKAAEDLSTLVLRMHEIATPKKANFAPVDLLPVISEGIVRAQERTGRDGEVEVLKPGRVTTAYADRELLIQVVEELLANALEAATEPKIAIRIQTDGVDGRLLIEVQDFGPGMSKHTLQHAFDPFFSGKPAGRNQGLGLARAHRLADAMGATILLESYPGEGTTARVSMTPWMVEARDAA